MRYLSILLLAAVVSSESCNGRFLHPNATGSQVIQNFVASFHRNSSISLTVSTGIFETTEIMGVKGVYDSDDDAALGLYPDNSNTLASVVRRAIWLNTSPPSNLSAIDLPYQGCSLALMSGFLARSDPGDCSSVFTQPCLKAIARAVNDTSIAQSIFNVTSQSHDCLSGLSTIPDECLSNKTSSDWAAQWQLTDTINPGAFSDKPSKRECNGIPIGSGNASTTGFSQGFASTTLGDHRTYDSEVRKVVPMIITVWSTGYQNLSRGWADTRMICVSTNNISPGSRTPSQRSNGDVKASVERALLALSFLVSIVVVWL